MFSYATKLHKSARNPYICTVFPDLVKNLLRFGCHCINHLPDTQGVLGGGAGCGQLLPGNGSAEMDVEMAAVLAEHLIRQVDHFDVGLDAEPLPEGG